MIQRIQTVYLLLIFILSIFFVSGEIITFQNSDYFSLSGIHLNNPGAVQKYWPLTILMLIVPVLSLITSILFKNRKMQMRFTIMLIICIIIMTFTGIYYVFGIIHSGNSPVLSVKMVIPLLMLIFGILAYRGIRKDEAVVRSYDRLR